MKLKSDKWVPSSCLILATFFGLSAYFLHSTQISVASSNILKEGSEEKILFYEPSELENVKFRYEAHSTSATATIESLKNSGNRFEPVKILIVPGHDAEYPGAELRNIKEADLNLKVATELFNFLKEEKGIEVFITRDDEDYDRKFKKYFEDKEEEIINFRDTYKRFTNSLIKSEAFEPVRKVEHNKAPEEVAFRLYGINKWANDNEIDLVIHIHFNDFPGRYRQGEIYNGFSIYIPQEGYRNYDLSIVTAEKIRESLNDFFPESNNPVEEDIVIEGSELIAIGANNTLESGSVLIEYGYIYENQFTDYDIKNEILRELAYRTYLGIKDLLIDLPQGKEGISTLLPNNFYRTLEKGTRYTLNTVQLQTTLAAIGNYPSEGNTFNDCPITGIFGPCTEKAVKEFQKENDIEITGIVDSETRSKLSEALETLLD